MDYKIRIESLKNVLGRKKLDGILIKKDANIRYLCGLDAQGSAYLLISKKGNFIITDARFKEVVQKELPDFILILIDGSRYDAIKSIVKRVRIKRLGFESDWLNYTDYHLLKNRLKPIAFLPTKDIIENLRIIKDPDEINLINRSVLIARKAYLYAKDKIRPGLNGDRLAVLIDDKIRRAGAARPAFQTIVAQNPYSSQPHALATKEPFKTRSAVVVDMGALYKGYNSDLTRLLFLGRISSKYRLIYDIIKTAQRLAIDKIRPGIKISEIDKAARQYIAKKGLKRHFLHSLGHGIGLEIHELPRISSKAKGVLFPGMVFTVEPGIYIPGWGGLRVEDMVLVREKGCEVLTGDIPK